MFTPPSVNQIASAYQGNPAPLNQKVDTDRKQNGGIPRDLRQLMAAYDLSQGRQNMGIQQALQIPTNMPTVAQDVQERARQAMQARMMQQAQEMQRKNGQPNMVPPGTPRPPMQAQGLDMLESNVGEEYAHGGIIGHTEHFQSKGSVQDPNAKEEATSDVGDFFRSIVKAISAGREKSQTLNTLASERFAASPGPLEALTPTQRAAREKQVATLSEQREQISDKGEITPVYPQGGKPIPGNYDRPTGVDDAAREVGMMLRQTPSALEAEAKAPAVPTKKVNPNAQTQTRVNTDSAPMPAGLKDLAGIPSMGAARSYERDRLREDPAKAMADMKALYEKEVGSRDLSIYDQMAEELRGRKERLNAPKAGYDATMELLEQIAAGGGRNWMEAGAKGVVGQRALQKSRLSEQDLLMEKILDLGAKKSDALFAEKKGMFDLTQGEKNRIIKDKQEIAKSLGLSEDKERELIENGIQKELDRKSHVRVAQIGAQDRDQFMSRAKALMVANPKLTLEEAMKRVSLAAGAAQLEGTEVRGLQAYNTAEAKLSERYPEWMMRDTPEGRKIRATYEKKLAELKSINGIPASGINALPGANPSGTVPPVGTVMEGYKFKGGNPRDQNNWEKV
jgi:hypothetical protein